jgi:hypothetical protein
MGTYESFNLQPLNRTWIQCKAEKTCSVSQQGEPDRLLDILLSIMSILIYISDGWRQTNEKKCLAYLLVHFLGTER